MRKTMVQFSFAANILLLLTLGAMAYRRPVLRNRVRDLFRPAQTAHAPAPFINHEDFDNLTVGVTPAGWTNGSHASWQVQPSGISAPNAMVLRDFALGRTLVWTGGGSEQSHKGICAQFSQTLNLDSASRGASVGVSLRTDGGGARTGYFWLPDFIKSPADSHVSLIRRIGGIDSCIAKFTTGLVWKSGDVALIKVQAAATALSFKIWKSGTIEPTVWSNTTLDTSIAGGGYVGFIASANNGSNASSSCALDDVFIGVAGSAFDVFPSQVLRGNSADLYYSGCEGSGSNWASSTTSGQLVSINPGAEIDLCAAGPTQVAIQVSTSNFDQIASFPINSYPKIKYSVDSGPMVEYQLQPGDRILRFGRMSRSLQIWLMGLDPYGGNVLYPDGAPLLTKWSGKNSLIIQGVFIDATATPSAYAAPVDTWLAFGDSITEGEWQLGDSALSTNAVAYEDATSSYAALLANAMGCQIINVGLGGSDYIGTFSGDVPPLTQTYDQIYSGIPRSVDKPPTYWSVNLGTNGRTSEASTIVASLSRIRQLVGRTSKGVLFVPFGGQIRGLVESAYRSYKASYPSDNLVLIDLNDRRYVATPGSPTAFSYDGMHPTQAGHSLIASQCIRALNDLSSQLVYKQLKH